MSLQPKGFLPQPIASAMGFHKAMTTGDKTRLSVEAMRSLPDFARDSAFASLINAAEAGLTRCACILPERMLSMDSPEPIGRVRTKIPLPPDVFTPLRLNAAVASLIHFSFSEPYGKMSSKDPRGATCSASLEESDGDLQPGAKSEETRTNKKTQTVRRNWVRPIGRRGISPRYLNRLWSNTKDELDCSR